MPSSRPHSAARLARQISPRVRTGLMFNDALLAQSAVDRFENAAFDFTIEGESYKP